MIRLRLLCGTHSRHKRSRRSGCAGRSINEQNRGEGMAVHRTGHHSDSACLSAWYLCGRFENHTPLEPTTLTSLPSEHTHRTTSTSREGHEINYRGRNPHWLLGTPSTRTCRVRSSSALLVRRGTRVKGRSVGVASLTSHIANVAHTPALA